MPRSLAVPLCALLSLALPANARAYEDQQTLAVGAGYRLALGRGAGDAPPTHGVGASLRGGLGLSPVWTLRGGVDYAHAPVGAGRQASHVVGAGAELLYLVDVLELVPYAGVGLSGVYRAAADASGVGARAELVAGFDYLQGWTWSLGLDLRVGAVAQAGADPFGVASIDVTYRRFFEF